MDFREDIDGDRHLHGDATFNFPLPGEFVGNLALFAERFEWGENPIQQTDYTEVEASVTLTYRGVVSLTPSVDMSNDPLVTADGGGNLSETLYGGLEVQVKPHDAWTIKAFYGGQKAGIRCAGGQCRYLPGFDGGRLSVVGTF
jgi:hypothetical protein